MDSVGFHELSFCVLAHLNIVATEALTVKI